MRIITLDLLNQAITSLATKIQNLFVEKETGKGLSTNDYTTAEKEKLSGLENYTHPDSGVTAGTYQKVTVDEMGHVIAGDNPTTLSGYGITDAAPKVHTHGSDDITELDASKLTGTIDIARIPAGALERLVIVADDDARLALTTNEVQNGDVVKVTETGSLYFVVDDTKLSTEAGYEIYATGTAMSVSWGGITDKPETYPPSAHTHGNDDITSVDVSKLTGTMSAEQLPEEVTGALLRSARANGLLSDALLVDTIDSNAKENMPHLVGNTSENKPDDMVWGIREIVYSSSGYLVARITGVATDGTGAIWIRSYSTGWESTWHRAVNSKTVPIFKGLYIDDAETGSYIGPDRDNNDRLFIRYRQADGSFGYRSIEALVAAAEGGHNHDARYLQVSGGDITGNITVGNKKIQLVGNDEGGNIVIFGANGQKWEIDAYNSTELRIFTYGSATNGNKIVGFTFKEDGTLVVPTLSTNSISGLALSGLATRVTKLESRVTALEAR